MADPEDLLQPGWREARRTINGLSLHLVEAGDPADPLLILLHGFPEFWWGWRHQIAPLAAAGTCGWVVQFAPPSYDTARPFACVPT